MRRKPSEKGFTLAETLLAVLILLMVSTIMAAGIPSAKNAYEKVVLASNAEVLLSTAISELRNELGTSQDVKTPAPQAGETTRAGTILTYYNPTRGASSRIYVDSTGNGDIMFQRYYSPEGRSSAYPAVRLVSPETATDDLYVTYDSVASNGGVITFQGLSVKRASGAATLASRGQLSIRVVSNRSE